MAHINHLTTVVRDGHHNAFTDLQYWQGNYWIGIHEAMDMTLPGLVSQQSIRENGQWLDGPDSRNW